MTQQSPNQSGSPEVINLGKLAHSLGFLMRMAQIETFESYHTELGKHGLKPGEFSTCWLISRYPGVRQGLVARSLRIKLAHMTKLVRNLEERDFLTREIPDDDRRSVLLHLTPNGQEFVQTYQDAFFENFLAKDSNMTADEVTTLVSLLQKFTGIRETM